MPAIDELLKRFSNIRSYSKDGIIATTYSDDYTIRGQHYEITLDTTINAETTKTFLLDLSALATAGKILIAGPTVLKTSGETIKSRLYEGTNYTGGTPITPINVNRMSENTAEVIITAEPSAPGEDPTKGTLIRSTGAFANTGPISQVSGSSEGITLILDSTKNYLLEVENEGADATNMLAEYKFYELAM